ncbi:MAG: PKD domain-containing protein [Candidatus Acetothermia bacterium]|jgi:PKD repeat protein|nr:PKD domain-containing protein [Candidatus Acetothermia bacterium]
MPLAVQFTDQSSGSVTDWLWDFGDGTTSTEQNPLHVYAKGGKFTVTLTVGYSGLVTSTVTKTNYIIVTWAVGPTPGMCTTIQGCIDAAAPGDTIVIKDGTYIENPNISKPLTLMAGSTPLVQGNMTISSSGVTVKGLKITGDLIVQAGAEDAVVTGCVIDGVAKLPAGSLTTTNFDAWGGVDGTDYKIEFDVDAAGVGNVGLRMYVYGLDMSQVIYAGSWGWPPTLDDLGGCAMAGITGSSSIEFDRPNAGWFQLHSALGTEKSWEQVLVDQNTHRKYLLQAWHRGLTGGKVFPDGPNGHQYNVERYLGPAGRPEAGCSGYTPDPEYDTFDLKIDFTPLGGGQYKMEGWVRLHKASSWDEMICKPHSFKWQWNKAINNVADPSDAWVRIGGHLAPRQAVSDHKQCRLLQGLPLYQRRQLGHDPGELSYSELGQHRGRRDTIRT